MSDFVRIRVTYPSQETENEAFDSQRGTAASFGDGGVDRSRGVNPLVFVVVGGLVVAGAIGAGLVYTGVSDPSPPVPVASQTTPQASPKPAEKTTIAAPSEPEPLRTAAAGDPIAGNDQAVGSVGKESEANFVTAGSGIAKDMETNSARTAPMLEPANAKPDTAALPPPVKKPLTKAAVSPPAAPPNESVARSQLTSAVRGREPVDQLASRVKIGKAGSRKLFYFTELKGLTGETIFHRWEHDGQTMVTLRFNVGSDRWRGYSSKTIPATQTGEWRVVVANAEGDVLASSQFVAE